MIRAIWITALLIAGSLQQERGHTDRGSIKATPTIEKEEELYLRYDRWFFLWPIFQFLECEFYIKRAAGSPSLVIRSDEELTYLVEIDIGPFKGLDVGEATFKSQVEGVDAASVGHFEATFKGSYLGYKLDHRLHSQHTQAEEITLESSDTQRGSENRRREIRVERREEGLTAVYSFDGHCKGCEGKAHFHKRWPWEKRRHCKDCDKEKHRVWMEPRERAVPADTLDFLSSIYLIRGFISAELEGIETPLLDKDRLWDLSLKTGEARDIEVPKGKYACRKIIIDAKKPANESHEKKFSGLFGMKGAMNFWAHESTGVMVQIAGELPFGLGVKIRLKDVKGAPAGLVPKGF